MVKKVYVIAYCKKNLGDDLMIQTLAKRYPETTFYLFGSPKYKAPFINEKNIHYPSNLNFFLLRILNKLRIINISEGNVFWKRRANLIIEIGGSMFIESSNCNDREVQKEDQGIYYVGVNFGPYKSKKYLDNVRNKFMVAEDCCLRDKYSYQLFQDIPVVRYAPDILFSNKNVPELKKGEGIGISIIELSRRETISDMADIYYRVIAEVCNIAIDKGIKITIFSFCKDEGDEEAISIVRGMIKKKEYVNISNYCGDTKETIDQLNNCEYILATRFHAMILGWVMGKKVFPIIYSKKQSNVMEDVGYQGGSWDLLAKQIYTADRLLEDCLKNQLHNVENQINFSEQQFSAIDIQLKAGSEVK